MRDAVVRHARYLDVRPKEDNKMTYRIEGLKRDEFAALFAMDDAQLAEHNAVRVTATGPGFPCRISLEDAQAGEPAILLNYTSHDVTTPFRSSYAIYVREQAENVAPLIDAAPPMLEKRTLGLRAFGMDGMLKDAAVALPGQADEKIRALFEAPEIAYIHAHNAAQGCFLARVERD
jgi:hypothetical protein